MEDPNLQALGKPKHVDCADDAGFGRLNWSELIMDGACRAGEIIDLVHLYKQRESDVVPHEFKTRIADEMIDIAFVAGKKVVDA